MIIDHERENDIDPTYIAGVEYIPNHAFTAIPRGENQAIEERTMMMNEMKNVEDHDRLRSDLMTEFWNTYSADDGGGAGGDEGIDNA